MSQKLLDDLKKKAGLGQLQISSDKLETLFKSDKFN